MIVQQYKIHKLLFIGGYTQIATLSNKTVSWFFSWEHKLPLMAGIIVHNSEGCWIDR